MEGESFNNLGNYKDLQTQYLNVGNELLIVSLYAVSSQGPHPYL